MKLTRWPSMNCKCRPDVFSTFRALRASEKGTNAVPVKVIPEDYCEWTSSSSNTLQGAGELRSKAQGVIDRARFTIDSSFIDRTKAI